MKKTTKVGRKYNKIENNDKKMTSRDKNQD